MKTSHHFNINDTLSKLSNDVAQLQPLASTMSNTLTQIGVTPPRELNNLTATFHDAVVAPVQGAISQNPVNNVLAFFRNAVTKVQSGQPTTPTEQTAGTGAASVLSRLQSNATLSGLFSSPVMIVVVVAIIGVIIIYLFVRK